VAEQLPDRDPFLAGLTELGPVPGHRILQRQRFPVDEHHGGELERALDEFVPRWLAETWRFGAVHYSP